MRRHVDLPQPDGPSSTAKLPAATAISTPSNAAPPGQRLTRPVSLRSAPRGEDNWDIAATV